MILTIQASFPTVDEKDSFIDIHFPETRSVDDLFKIVASETGVSQNSPMELVVNDQKYYRNDTRKMEEAGINEYDMIEVKILKNGGCPIPGNVTAFDIYSALGDRLKKMRMDEAIPMDAASTKKAPEMAKVAPVKAAPVKKAPKEEPNFANIKVAVKPLLSKGGVVSPFGKKAPAGGSPFGVKAPAGGSPFGVKAPASKSPFGAKPVASNPFAPKPVGTPAKVPVPITQTLTSQAPAPSTQTPTPQADTVPINQVSLS